jgi:hypothetical protein
MNAVIHCTRYLSGIEGCSRTLQQEQKIGAFDFLRSENKISCEADSLNQTVLYLTFPLSLLFLLGLSYIFPSLLFHSYLPS